VRRLAGLAAALRAFLAAPELVGQELLVRVTQAAIQPPLLLAVHLAAAVALAQLGRTRFLPVLLVQAAQDRHRPLPARPSLTLAAAAAECTQAEPLGPVAAAAAAQAKPGAELRQPELRTRVAAAVGAGRHQRQRVLVARVVLALLFSLSQPPTIAASQLDRP